MMNRLLKHLFLFFTVCAYGLLAASCHGGGSNLRVFDMVRQDGRLKPDTIAVIAGKSKDQDYNLAKYISARMKESTAFKVVSQDTLSGKIPNYPYYDIVGEWGNPPEGENNVAWFSPANTARVKSLRKYIKTKYVFVVWTDQLNATDFIMNNTSQRSYSIVVYGRLFSYPKGEIVGYTVYVFGKRSWFWDIFKSSNQEIDEMLQSSAKQIVKNINEFANDRKKVK